MPGCATRSKARAQSDNHATNDYHHGAYGDRHRWHCARHKIDQAGRKNHPGNQGYAPRKFVTVLVKQKAREDARRTQNTAQPQHKQHSRKADQQTAPKGR